MLNFPENIILEDERVILRRLKEDDLEHFLYYTDHEPGLWPYSLTALDHHEGMIKYFKNALQQHEKKIEYPFIIFDKPAQRYAGSSRFYDIQLANQTAQLGYTWYGHAFQRSGLNRHCKLLLLTYAFEVWGLERVEFRADARNEPSINAMKAIGCTVEGILRSNVAIETGGRRDSIVLSILKNEWLGGVKENLIKKIY